MNSQDDPEDDGAPQARAATGDQHQPDASVWAELNRRRKDDVRKWIQTDVCGNLPILREVLTPLHGLMAHMLMLSGPAYERKQAALAAQGKPRGYVITSAAQGAEVDRCFHDLLNVICSDARGLPTETFAYSKLVTF